MAPRKLSESDKQAILTAYRQSSDTTVTLASQYSVSTSTISRILKQSLPEAEYEDLVQQKRSGAFKHQPEQEVLPGLEPAASQLRSEPFEELPASPNLAVELESSEPDPAELEEAASRRQRKRITPKPAPPPILNKQSNQVEADSLADEPVTLEAISQLTRLAKDLSNLPIRKTSSPALVKDQAFTALTDSDLADDLDDDELADDLEDDLDDDDLDDDSDDSELDDSELSDEDDGLGAVQIPSGQLIQVLPLSEAQIPRTCYVVVDRASELITRPLKDFAELGQIPVGEVLEKTLPIFDNHRIAKRFLRRMQRVVKVPDGKIFQKVSPYLQAKGITRLLIDGQIYSL